jgi:hypothetical protein
LVFILGIDFGLLISFFHDPSFQVIYLIFHLLRQTFACGTGLCFGQGISTSSALFGVAEKPQLKIIAAVA